MLGLTPVDDVIETLIGMAKPIDDEDSVPIQDALGRVLSSDVQAAVDVPSFTNSSMDGYACCAEDLSAGSS